MKNKKAFTVLCLILFLSAIGCSDYDNWLSEDLEQMEQNQYEKENELKVKKENAAKELRDLRIKAIKDIDLKRRDVESEIEIDYENEKKQNINTYKNSELEKRDKDGNKTYWENE